MYASQELERISDLMRLGNNLQETLDTPRSKDYANLKTSLARMTLPLDLTGANHVSGRLGSLISSLQMLEQAGIFTGIVWGQVAFSKTEKGS